MANVFKRLKLDVQQDTDMVDCAFMFDSMSIRKQTVWDLSASRYIGFVDYGAASIEPVKELTSEVLVILRVGLKKKWKYPVGYFLINKIVLSIQCELFEQHS